MASKGSAGVPLLFGKSKKFVGSAGMTYGNPGKEKVENNRDS